MSITETPAAPPPAKPKQKRKPQRKPAAAPAEPMSRFAGITPRDCPIACVPTKCVISERDQCCHPHKGGLPGHLQTPEALRRSNEAKRILGKQKLDLTTV